MILLGALVASLKWLQANYDWLSDTIWLVFLLLVLAYWRKSIDEWNTLLIKANARLKALNPQTEYNQQRDEIWRALNERSTVAG